MSIKDNLRPYQFEAHNAVMNWVRTTIDPCLVEAATGAGKSMCVSSIANELYEISGGKKVLCTAPNADLVMQNREKYRMTGEPASIYSASAGEKSLRHPVVFGTPGTIIKRIKAFQNDFCAIIIDECHRITPQVKLIIEKMRAGNPRLRVIGLTATPYRLGEGYIYALDENDKPNGDMACRDPYFAKKVYTVGARHLIDQGFLTPPVIGQIGGDHYETLDMEVNRQGQFNSADIDKAFHGHGRKTSRIVGDVVEQSKGRRGVMLFAATVQHAEEIMASLPPGLSRMIGGKTNTKKADRQKLIDDFKAQRYKYLVSVETMTTGVDFTHVDVIALLRSTESVSLLQQIVGRGLRIHEGKQDVKILDYAENLDRHCPDGDLFSPEIRASFKGESLPPIEAECPSCKTLNTFSARKNEDGFDIDQWGYFLDLAGNRIETDYGHMPAHYGRRCQGMQKYQGSLIQCDHRWTLKECPGCAHENDIAAKYCESCRFELVNPNEKLRAEFKQLKRDPTQIQTDEVIDWSVKPTVSRKGNECLVVNYVTPYRSFTVWYHPHVKGGRPRAQWLQFQSETQGGEVMPKTVQYSKDRESGFYNVYAYNVPPDVHPDEQEAA